MPPDRDGGSLAGALGGDASALLGLAQVQPGGLVLGFEAIPRTDLPPETQRHPYTLDGKSRAIVTLVDAVRASEGALR